MRTTNEAQRLQFDLEWHKKYAFTRVSPLKGMFSQVLISNFSPLNCIHHFNLFHYLFMVRYTTFYPSHKKVIVTFVPSPSPSSKTMRRL